MHFLIAKLNKLSNSKKLKMKENLKLSFQSTEEKKNFMKISSTEGLANLWVCMCVLNGDRQNTNYIKL